MSAAPRIVVADATGPLIDSDAAVVFGTRAGCDVVLDDAVAAGRHCEFVHDGAFRVRDLGSVSGTWLDGTRVAGAMPVPDGGTLVLGTSRLVAKHETRDGVPCLSLQLQRNAFWWRKSGKQVFDNDPDALVRSEVAFGRFPALRAGNRIALVAAAALLLGGAFVAAVIEPLADAGPLLPVHATVTSGVPVAGAHAGFARCQALAAEQGCNVCHTTGAGAPESKCLQCHEDLRAPATWRHPYHNDGALGPLPGMHVDDAFCVVCHQDHQGADFLKAASDRLVGDCAACHGTLDDAARTALLAKVPVTVPPPRLVDYDTYRFPHAAHLAPDVAIDCRVCHRVDPDTVARRRDGLPDDPDRHDFATVPYETCAACHVPGAPDAGIDAQQLERWRPEERHRWPVSWHGTDEGGQKCAACHAAAERGGARVFGPELRTVVRPAATAEQYAAERARYTVPARTHAEQFAAHAAGRACTSCHVGALPAAIVREARPFWHALHLADGALRPAADRRGPGSIDAEAGCLSCHQDLRDAGSLRDATTAAYHWPATDAAQAACRTCHREGERTGGRALPLQAASTSIPPERRSLAGAHPADFPHDVHVRSAAFGVSGSLAAGCFACHEFVPVAGGRDFESVPRTRPGAADCTDCHAGHADVGGGACQQCHPAEAGRSNSFLAASRVAPGTLVRGRPTPEPPRRSWPGQNRFSHLSPGHSRPDLGCDDCHDRAGTAAAATLDAVPIPDDRHPSCRECHLQRQFHWR